VIDLIILTFFLALSSIASVIVIFFMLKRIKVVELSDWLRLLGTLYQIIQALKPLVEKDEELAKKIKFAEDLLSITTEEIKAKYID